ncbi:MAG: hypothetical protein DI527_00580 [Chelatococcus sp.]|nr:MAG: hypothetical protein DI527_00580 [Chelatococcus sp.]
MTAADLPPEIVEHYLAMRTLPDGRLIGIAPLLFHLTLHVDVHCDGYEDRYCYATFEAAEAAMNAWDGTGDPVGWHRHPLSGRRRDLATGREWIAR